MNQFVRKLREEVKGSLKTINQGSGQVLCKGRECIEILEKAFDELKRFILCYRFENEQEEIAFFKQVKPSLFCHLIYYRKVYNIEMYRPKGGSEVQSIYLKKELRRINDFFMKNTDFFHYYSTGCTHMDKVYFLRGKPEISLNLESFYFERDPRFSTNCDFKVAKILANDMLESYINKELYKLKNPQKDYSDLQPMIPLKEKLSWTASKVFLVELIYAFYLAGVFNHGKASLKRISSYFEQVFNIDLGTGISRTFTDICRRKEPTSFLDMLKKLLNNKMNQRYEK